MTNRLLPALRETREEPFMKTEELVSKIEKEECPGLDREIIDNFVEVIDKVVDFLDEAGEVRCF